MGQQSRAPCGQGLYPIDAVLEAGGKARGFLTARCEQSHSTGTVHNTGCCILPGLIADSLQWDGCAVMTIKIKKTLSVHLAGAQAACGELPLPSLTPHCFVSFLLPFCPWGMETPVASPPFGEATGSVTFDPDPASPSL